MHMLRATPAPPTAAGRAGGKNAGEAACHQLCAAAASANAGAGTCWLRAGNPAGQPGRGQAQLAWAPAAIYPGAAPAAAALIWLRRGLTLSTAGARAARSCTDRPRSAGSQVSGQLLSSHRDAACTAAASSGARDALSVHQVAAAGPSAQATSAQGSAAITTTTATAGCLAARLHAQVHPENPAPSAVCCRAGLWPWRAVLPLGDCRLGQAPVPGAPCCSLHRLLNLSTLKYCSAADRARACHGGATGARRRAAAGPGLCRGRAHRAAHPELWRERP